MLEFNTDMASKNLDLENGEDPGCTHPCPQQHLSVRMSSLYTAQYTDQPLLRLLSGPPSKSKDRGQQAEHFEVTSNYLGEPQKDRGCARTLVGDEGEMLCSSPKSALLYRIGLLVSSLTQANTRSGSLHF